MVTAFSALQSNPSLQEYLEITVPVVHGLHTKHFVSSGYVMGKWQGIHLQTLQQLLHTTVTDPMTGEKYAPSIGRLTVTNVPAKVLTSPRSSWSTRHTLFEILLTFPWSTNAIPPEAVPMRYWRYQRRIQCATEKRRQYSQFSSAGVLHEIDTCQVWP